MSNFAGLTLIAAILSGPSGEYLMHESPFEITVECKKKFGQCFFDGTDVDLQIVVQNRSSSPVRIPLRYLKLRGPFLAVIDPKTGRQNDMRVGNPDRELRKELQTIASGESFTLTASLDAINLRPYFVGRTSSVVAVVNVPTDVLLPTGELKIFDNTKTIEVIAAAGPLESGDLIVPKKGISPAEAKELLDIFNSRE